MHLLHSYQTLFLQTSRVKRKIYWPTSVLSLAILNCKKVKSSRSIQLAWGKCYPQFYWSSSSMVMKRLIQLHIKRQKNINNYKTKYGHYALHTNTDLSMARRIHIHSPHPYGCRKYLPAQRQRQQHCCLPPCGQRCRSLVRGSGLDWTPTGPTAIPMYMFCNITPE